jgi:ABC-2 type transport system permease protein
VNLLAAGAEIAAERATGQLRRTFMAPVGTARIVVGMLLGRVAVGWVQTAWMLALGVVVFGIRWAEHPFVLFAFLTLFALCSTALGMVAGTLLRDPDQAEAAAVWGGILLSPLGGLWWPLEVVPPTMRAIGRAVPTGWAMESVNAMLAFGAGAAEIAPYAAALAAVTAAALALVIRRLRP